MADFNSVVLTERGIALMTKAIAGECTTEFTKIQSGDGVWSTSLSQATSLKNVRQEFGVSRAYVVNESTVAVLGVLSNLNLSEGYYVREYGIFACEEGKESSTEVLYAIVTASEPDYMPPYNSVQPQTMELETYLAVANASNVTIKTGTGALASAEDLQKLADNVSYLSRLVQSIVSTGKISLLLTTEDGNNLTTESGKTLIATKKIGGN